MRIIVGSDFHGDEEMVRRFSDRAREERAEIVLVCGDITNFGTVGDAERLLSIVTETKVPVLFVPGNCDPRSLLDLELEGAVQIHGRAYQHGDYIFVGVGGSPPTPFHTFFEMDEEQIMAELDGALRDVDVQGRLILVSHSPPHNTRLDKTHLHLHAGSRSVRRFIEERKPLAVFCGHIHEARGEDRIGDTVIVNPGPVRHGYYVSAQLEADSINVKFGVLDEK